MTDQDWFKTHPKVSAYIDQGLYQRLQDYMARHGYKKVGAALTAILEAYLGIEPTLDQFTPNAPTQLDQIKPVSLDQVSLNQITARLDALEKAIAEIRQQPAKTTPRTARKSEPVVLPPKPPGLEPNPETSPGEGVGELVAIEEAAARLGLAAGSLRSAKNRGQLPIIRNGWVATPTDQRQGRGLLWRVWREG